MLFWLCLVTGFVLDRVTKLVIVGTMRLGQSIPVIRDIFHLTYVLNDGAAFNLFRGQRYLFLVVTVIAMIAVLLYLRRVPKEDRLIRLALGLFCGGALGNFFDRMAYGQVVDFLDFRVFPIFNLADCCIVVGCCLLLIAVWRSDKKSQEEAPVDVTES